MFTPDKQRPHTSNGHFQRQDGSFIEINCPACPDEKFWYGCGEAKQMRELLEEIDDPECMTRLCRHVSRSVQTYMTTDMNEDTLLGLQQLRDGAKAPPTTRKRGNPQTTRV